ncbi:hypothetical protein SCD_n03047 (plasmid) [Sulfuricella denitrificans skB26]|uniref:Transmembrane protein n=1 Tax=Sulfuricella denitrificans (strain DSM 22764 / NBRC 105220 / skB26) TaxID=1163617 RepID=S6AKC3_SULDS|nr:hypothetical protein [Sulfuricella denitrificans]BAN36846.1 hypothetical protein SCD_n03047 [Sulfuricella denitrificans skB26]
MNMDTSVLFDKLSDLKEEYVGEPTGLYSFWSLVNISMVAYLGYWAIDFILFPRANVPNPAGDVQFGYFLGYLALIFLLTWLAVVEILRIWSLGVFFSSIAISMLGFNTYQAMHGNVLSIFLFIMMAVAILMLALSAAIGRREIRNGADPEEVVEDYLDALWSNDMGQYRTLQKLRRQNRLQEELIEEFRHNRNSD